MNDDWLPIAEAARRLTAAGDVISQSALSRYLQKHSDNIPMRETARAKLVNMDALAGHRSENIRVAGQAGFQAAITAARSFADVVAPQLPPSMAGQRQALSPSARKATAEAEIKEMDLALRRGELVPTAEVKAACMDSIALMKTAFDRALEKAAAEASLKWGWDERQARVALKSFAKSGLETFHVKTVEYLDRLAAAGEGMPAPEANPED